VASDHTSPQPSQSRARGSRSWPEANSSCPLRPASSRTVHNLAKEQIEGVLELNLTSAVILTRLVLPGSTDIFTSRSRSRRLAARTSLEGLLVEFSAEPLAELDR
jgi:hypothetical protein